MAAIRTEGLAKTYGDLRALDGLDVAVERGELFGFLGPNGAGKTTTIRILTGQLRPDAGEASVLGVDPVAEPVAVREKIGVLPERESPPAFMTPREYFEFVGTVRGMGDETIASRVETWADRLDFGAKLDTLSTDLSRGQQQKVMIAQAFLHDPDAVFIDEPLANLDPIVQERVKAFLREYVAEDNAAFISTHDIGVAEEICDRVGVVTEGELIADRDPSALGPDESLLDLFLHDVEGS
ncbi:MAG: ABC transporter ATP-binding protein [Halobacteriaceae archaeon]